MIKIQYPEHIWIYTDSSKNNLVTDSAFVSS